MLKIKLSRRCCRVTGNKRKTANLTFDVPPSSVIKNQAAAFLKVQQQGVAVPKTKQKALNRKFYVSMLSLAFLV
jgi:hypothetical protein